MTAEAETKFESEYATKVIPKAWSDPEYKRKLLADPRAALQEVGIVASTTVNIKVVENTNDTVHLILPAPLAAEISDESLDLVTGGWKDQLSLSVKAIVLR